MNRGLCPLSDVSLERGVEEQSLSRVWFSREGTTSYGIKADLCGWHGQDREITIC
jgi:hypothetical protein